MIKELMLWLKMFVFTDEKGQTLAEYALILALIAIVVITILGTLGTNINTIFTKISDNLGAAAK